MSSDIICPGCGEPWEVYHMRHDEPREWGLSDENEEALLETGTFRGENDPAKKAAESAGWKFYGNSLYGFLQCPCCCKHPPLPDAETRKSKVIIVADMAGDDHDFLASEISA